jgi:hypothetical protein
MIGRGGSMKRNFLSILTLFLLVSLCAGVAFAQVPAPATDAEGDETVLPSYDDHTIKGYSLSFFGGQFSGDKYLENQKLAEFAHFIEGANDIIAYDGEVLIQSKDYNHWDAAHKEIEPGTVFGTRIGMYISDDFHLDILGVYGSSTATTTMLQTATLDGDPNFVERRVELDTDDGFKMFKGGLAFQYDGNKAKVFGIRPRIGFGLGGIINRYSQLSDVTALYLDANFGLDYPIMENLNIAAGLDMTTFAFKVEELGYSNMVSYSTFTIGLTYFIDVLPEPVRAAHKAELENRR